MANKQGPSKAEVQSTKLNEMPDGKMDTEMSAEVAADAFETKQGNQNNQNSQNQQRQSNSGSSIQE